VGAIGSEAPIAPAVSPPKGKNPPKTRRIFFKTKDPQIKEKLASKEFSKDMGNFLRQVTKDEWEQRMRRPAQAAELLRYDMRMRFPVGHYLEKLPAKISLAQLAAVSPEIAKMFKEYFAELAKPDPSYLRPVNTVMSAWYLPVRLQGKPLSAMVDTGSVITLMGEPCANRLGLKTEQCPPIAMKLADNSRTMADRTITDAEIEIGNLSIPVDIRILPRVTYDMILGKDFLQKVKAKMTMDEAGPTMTIRYDDQKLTRKLYDKDECIGLIADGQDREVNAINVDSMYTMIDWDKSDLLTRPQKSESHKSHQQFLSTHTGWREGENWRSWAKQPTHTGPEAALTQRGQQQPEIPQWRDKAHSSGQSAARERSASQARQKGIHSMEWTSTTSPTEPVAHTPESEPQLDGIIEAKELDWDEWREYLLGKEIREMVERSEGKQKMEIYQETPIFIITTDDPKDQKEQAQWIMMLKKDYPNILETKIGPGAKTCGVKHIIETNGRPFKTRAYRTSPKDDETLRKEIDTLLETGIIRPTNSPYASGVVMVPKKDGTTRVCIDYRKLNEQTTKDTYPLPLMEELLERIAGCESYTTLDLNQGYHQIPMDEESIPKTAFTCKYGTYEYTVMPFGLTNAPATFQRAMDNILDPHIRQGKTHVYLDDVCIGSTKQGDHEKDVRNICQTLSQHNLKIKPSKCTFNQTRVQFLGHIVDKQGIHVDPSKTSAYISWGTPKTTRDVRSFLGAVGYYRRFIPGFAEPTAKLTPLLKKNAKFQWKPEHQEAMEQLKHAMTNPPVLKPPDFTKPFLVVTDASDYAIGGALMQIHDNKEHPIRYWSRTLQPAERNYSTTDKEALAVVQCFKQFRCYLLGAKVILFTDHQALKYVLTAPRPTGRIARWITTLLEYDYEIRHRPGNKNLLADSLSRDPSLRAVIVDLTQDPDIDDLLFDVKKYHEGKGELTHTPLKRARKITRLATTTYMKNGELYKRRANGHAVRVLLSRKARQQALTEAHNGLAHMGEKTTWDIISNTAWWPDARKDTINHVKTCEICQRFNRLQKPPPPIQIPVQRLFERFALDYVGPLPETHQGNRYILVATEALTRWPIAKAVPDADAETSARFIYEEIVMQYGPPETILTDRGTHFVNKIVDQISMMLEIRQLRTTPYHPQTNGMTERFNGTLCTALAKLSMETGDNWDTYINDTLYAYKIRKHTTLGKSPYEAMYGTPPKTPAGIALGPEPTEEQRPTIQQAIRETAKRPEVKKASKFKENQQVLWKSGLRRNKLEQNLFGPYLISKCGPNNTYLLTDDYGNDLPVLVSGDKLQTYQKRSKDIGRRTVVPKGVT
jgi:hypothetical protein